MIFLILWLFTGGYGGWMIYLAHCAMWKRYFRTDRKPMPHDLILLAMPLTGIVGLIMGCVIYYLELCKQEH